MMRAMPSGSQLPYALYRAEQVRELDRLAMASGIPGSELMQRAGEAAFRHLQDLWPACQRMTVVTGVGNNAGDGYVIARLALQAGISVEILELGDTEKLTPDGLHHFQLWQSLSSSEPVTKIASDTQLIVDAVLGTGLDRPVEGRWAETIEAMNRHQADIFAIDIPSGLLADTGQIAGVAIQAKATISFIGLKRGLFTGAGRQLCGEIIFDALAIPARVYASQILDCRRLDWDKARQLISPRPRHAHKGDFGHVLVIGGNQGMSGAARLSAEAAARSGAGLVSVATHARHAVVLNLGRPELMVREVNSATDLEPLIRKATVIVIGPGLGQDDWSRMLFDAALVASVPLVIDADALNLLSEKHSSTLTDCVLTPHPGEAARLLGCAVREIERDRFAAVQALQQRFECPVILKGSGTLVASAGQRPPALCSDGNPGMASGGMGDVLAGIIAAMIAQGQDLQDAAELGVALHARAADLAAQNGETGMLASDLFGEIRSLMNV